MGCGCKKNKSQTTVPTVNVNQVQLQNETQQSSNDTQIVDMIMEKLKTVEEEQNNEQSQ
jgi:predicted FMN-binding regulatory protein PaiB